MDSLLVSSELVGFVLSSVCLLFPKVVLTLQFPVLDVAVCVFIMGSLVHLLISKNSTSGAVDVNKSLRDPSLLYLNVDSLATFRFGLLRHAYRDWLHGFQATHSLH